MGGVTGPGARPRPHRLRVMLLFGGQSAEHDVSRVTAVAVAKALDPDKYDIVPVGKLWGVQHDGKVNGKYSTKESAFESAAAAASMAIHQGHEVHISVPSGEESGAASKAV